MTNKSMNLEDVKTEITNHLNTIKSYFLKEVELTFIMRNPKLKSQYLIISNDDLVESQYLIISNDDLVEISKLLKSSKVGSVEDIEEL